MKRYLLIILIFSLFSVSKILAADMVDINTASLAQLETLTGIGPVYAQKIIDGRLYSSVDDLLRVSGIGPKTLQKIKDQGLACVNCGQTQQPDQQTSQTTTQTPAPATAPTTATNEQSNDTTSPAIMPALSTAPAVTYLNGIFINEILPNPQGPDALDEWIELYNSNSFDVNLSGWQLQDRAGTITTYTIPSTTTIPAGGFLIFKRPDTNIMLNNDGDGVNLLTPDGKIIDSMGFMNAPLGQSYNKTTNDWAWSTTLTPGSQNIVTALAFAQGKPVSGEKTSSGLSKTKNSVKNNSVEPGLADLNQTLDNNQEDTSGNPWFLFFAVLAATIILATIVLLIKLKFSNKLT